MEILHLKKQSIHKNIYPLDENKRDINIYKFSNSNISGHNLYYPNCLLYSENTLYLPLLEKTMSLNMGTIYEKHMKFDYEPKDNNRLEGNYFFFVSN